MKIIFLDIDGVLNCQSSKSRCGGFIGVDNAKIKQLRRIVDATNAKIVLSSSWKHRWFRINKEDQDREANYLDRHLRDEGLFILDKTEDRNGSSFRGDGIKQWLQALPDGAVENFVILDDEVFDFAVEGLLPHLVQSSFYAQDGGLTEELADLAIRILNEGPGATQAIPKNFIICSRCIHKNDCDYRESRDGCYNGEWEDNNE